MRWEGRHSVSTEGVGWRAGLAEYDVPGESGSWVHRPLSPLSDVESVPVSPPPLVSSPIGNDRPDTAHQYLSSAASRWGRIDNAYFPLISFNWRCNILPKISICAGNYVDSGDVGFIISNVRDVALLGDLLGQLGSEVRISARRIRDINLAARTDLVEVLGIWQISTHPLFSHS